jgi:hypothetical protein
MKTIVQLRFGADAKTKMLDRTAPFIMRGAGAISFYENEPNVMSQLDDAPLTAYFEAELQEDGKWRFGQRVYEEDWLRHQGRID